MTIGDHIKQQRHPYRIAAYIFGVLAIVSFIGAGILIWQYLIIQKIDIEPSWYAWAVRLGWVVGFFGWNGAMIIPFLTLRCPRCQKRIGTPAKNWQHCPCCGCGFDEEI